MTGYTLTCWWYIWYLCKCFCSPTRLSCSRVELMMSVQPADKQVVHSYRGTWVIVGPTLNVTCHKQFRFSHSDWSRPGNFPSTQLRRSPHMSHDKSPLPLQSYIVPLKWPVDMFNLQRGKRNEGGSKVTEVYSTAPQSSAWHQAIWWHVILWFAAKKKASRVMAPIHLSFHLQLEQHHDHTRGVPAEVHCG